MELKDIVSAILVLVGFIINNRVYDYRMGKALQKQADENAKKIKAETEKIAAEKKKVEAEERKTEAEAIAIDLGAAKTKKDLITQLFSEIESLRNNQRHLEHLVGQAQSEAQVAINSLEKYKGETDKQIISLRQENQKLRDENKQLREEFDLYKKNSAAELANAYKRASELESENHALRNRKQSMTLRQATDD